MAVTCPSCGAEAAGPGARHCHNCGSPLPTSQDAGGTGQPDGAAGPGDSPPAGPRPAGPVGTGPQAGGPPQGSADWGPGGGDRQPHPSGLSDDSRNWGMLAHLSALVGLVIGFSFVGPLVVWLVKREQDPYVDYHGKEALNFNISVLLYAIISALLILVIIGIALLLAVGIAWLVLTIIAGVRASNGEYYRYPFTIRFVS